jgi:hypothetical protein
MNVISPSFLRKFAVWSLLLLTVFSCFDIVQAASLSLPQPAKIGLPFEGNSSAPISIAKIIKQAIMFAGILAVMAITYGGILMMLSYGDESKVKGAKSIIQYALIGIVLSGAAYAIIDAVNSLKLN